MQKYNIESEFYENIRKKYHFFMILFQNIRRIAK